MTRMSLALALTFTVAATSVEAQDTPPSQAAFFNGVWVHAGDREEEEERRKAIETTVNRLSVFVRGTARQRLTERTTPAPELELGVEGERLQLSSGEERVSLRLGARPVTIERDRRRGDMSARFDGQRLIVVSEREDGKRETTYTLSPDRQRLTLSVRLSGERLPGPLGFQATYRRKGTGPADKAPPK